MVKTLILPLNPSVIQLMLPLWYSFTDMPHTLLITYLDIPLGKTKLWRGGKVLVWHQQVQCPKQIRLL